ncbi:hypothetical protein PMAYCL1PPCAC_17296, partial [Pristionchus mayeri]
EVKLDWIEMPFFRVVQSIRFLRPRIEYFHHQSNRLLYRQFSSVVRECSHYESGEDGHSEDVVFDRVMPECLRQRIQRSLARSIDDYSSTLVVLNGSS